MSKRQPTTPEEARRVGDAIGVDWERLERMEETAKREWAERLRGS